MSVIQNDQALSFLSVAQQIEESEHRAVPLSLTFPAPDGSTEYILTMQNLQARDFIQTIRAFWVDNTLGNQPFAIFFPTTRQKIQVPAGYQGYVNVLSTNPARIVFSSTASTTVQLSLLNYPVRDRFWTPIQSPILEATGIITSAQILALSATPVTLIPAQGVGTVIVPQLLTLNYIFGGTAYVTAGINMDICYAINNNAFDPAMSATLLGNTANAYTFYETFATISNGGKTSNLVTNLPLCLGCPVSSPTVGNGTLIWTLFYRVLNSVL